MLTFEFFQRILKFTTFLLFLDQISHAQPHTKLSSYQIQFLNEFRNAYYNLYLEENIPKLELSLEKIGQPEQSTMRALLAYTIFSLKSGSELEEQTTKDFQLLSDEATLRLKNKISSNSEDQISKLHLGLIYGLIGSVELAYKKNYFQAYRYGSTGMSILDEVFAKDPRLADTQLSRGIMKIMIAQSEWYIRWFAPIILESGSTTKGLQILEGVVQNARYVQDEALLAHTLLLCEDLSGNELATTLKSIKQFVDIYPDCLQLYILLAQGFWKLKQFESANFYALKGLERLNHHDGRFVRSNLNSIQSFLYFWHYRYLVEKKEWLKILHEVNKRKDSIIQMTFQAIPLQYLGRTEEAKLLSKKTFEKLEESELKMPLFMVPIQLDLAPTLRKILQSDLFQKG